MPEQDERDRTEQLFFLAWLLRLFKRDVRMLAELLRNGEIALTEWRFRMARTVKRLHASAAMIALEGELDDETLALVEDRVREQYEYLTGFALAVQETEELTAAVDARAMLYAGAAWATFWLVTREREVEAKEVRWSLTPAEHCVDCVELDARGWMPIEELGGQVPGDGTTICKVNCKCVLSFR